MFSNKPFAFATSANIFKKKISIRSTQDPTLTFFKIQEIQRDLKEFTLLYKWIGIKSKYF